MKAIINPSAISGTVAVPPSKSMMQRACAAALLHKGKTTILSPGFSDDEKAALEIIEQLGARIISQNSDRIEIISDGVKPIADEIDCIESGLCARLFTPIASISDKAMKIKAHGSLLQRPMQEFEKVLPQLNVTLPDFTGYLPFSLKGPLKAASITVDGSESSQFVSGLLFALSYAATEAIQLEVREAVSKPYIDMTLAVLEHFGKPVSNDNYQSFHIDPALFVQKEHIEIQIEADWSNAAFWLLAGALNGNITLKGLNLHSAQADKTFLQALQSANVGIVIEEYSITVQSGDLSAFEFDASDCPDLFPALAILAACCNGESYIKGVHRLFNKESNRAESISEMLQQFGVFFAIEDDALCIRGAKQLQSTMIDSFNDHRIVMAAAIASLKCKGPVSIVGAEAINKSYPDFFRDLGSLGIIMELA